MMRPTPAHLLERALAEASGGRNNGGYWLARQLHANGYSQTDAEEIMRSYARAVPQESGKRDYTEREALATLKAECKRKPAEPWATADGSSGGYKSVRLTAARRAMEIKPRVEPEADPRSVAQFRREAKTLRPFAGSPAEEYLCGRGIPAELARISRVKYSPEWLFENADGTWGRQPAVVFPFLGKNGKPVAAQGRRLESSSGNTKTTFGPKTMGPFLTSNVSDAGLVAITEAPIDALTLALAGVTAIATGGKGALPPWIIAELARPVVPGRSRTVLTATDADDAGDHAAQKIADELSLVRIVRLRPPAKDWNAVLTEQGPVELCNRIDAAVWDLKEQFPERPDPRPELVEDSNPWMRLLNVAQASGPLFGVIHGFRCMGARLTPTGIQYDPEREGFRDQADFDDAYGGWLRPFDGELSSMIRDAVASQAGGPAMRPDSLIQGGVFK